jgi:murein L,D-transpeptidase YcbB/YkuD
VSWQAPGAHIHLLTLGLAGLAAFAALELAACNRTSEKPVRTAAAPQLAASRPPPPPPPPLKGQDASMALETLESAPDHGFPARRFHTKQIERLLASAAASDRAQGERLLRSAVLDYARAQHGLTIPGGALPRAWNQRPSTYDAEAELNAAIRGGRLRAWLDELPPQTPVYLALQIAYVAAKEHPPKRRPKVEAGPLDLGEQDARTEALRKRLALEDPKPEDVDAEAPVDDDLILALRAYQAAHGLEETGVLDEATAQRLNTPVLDEAAKLRANMERLRWLPRPEPERRIDVNIAAAELDYFRDGQLSTHMLAVSGKPGDETPIVSSAIDSIVLNPPWYVPPEIARREIIPRGEAYMRARGFVWRNGRLMQQPGRGASLGRVKFDFPNPYAVYLHDTPTRSTFSQAQRTASHGCVRLEHAVALAKTLVAEEPGSSVERVDRILSSGKTARLQLTRQVPVRLVYLTAVPKDGAIAYLPDVYHWDPKLLALLDRYQAQRTSSALH